MSLPSFKKRKICNLNSNSNTPIDIITNKDIGNFKEDFMTGQNRCMIIHKPFELQINEKKIHSITKKNFSKIAPFWYKLFSNWLIHAYQHFNDIDKFLIIIYLINKNLIFFRKNGLIIDYDTFYKNKILEIEKINISDISRDLQIPKESARRKVLELEKKNII